MKKKDTPSRHLFILLARRSRSLGLTLPNPGPKSNGENVSLATKPIL
jgi:hypothetical protein